MTDEFFETVGTQAPRHDPKRLNEAPQHGLPAVETPLRQITGSGAWAEGDGAFWCTARSHKTLPVGFYRMELHPQVGPMFLSQRNDTDALLTFPDSESDKLIEEIKIFKGLREAFRKHGFLYKRGILMWGPPGSGKTATLQLLVRLLMNEHDTIAVQIERPHVAAECLQALRRIEPERQVVAIMEDIDALIERYGESEYLALLDGESQVDNIVFVATTNYPERLDRRFVDRPSRFDTIRYIGMPSEAARRVYLAAKAPELSELELTAYAKASDGYSVAHLRELIILTQCFGVSLKDAKARLDKTRTSKPSSERAPDAAGFGFVG